MGSNMLALLALATTSLGAAVAYPDPAGLASTNVTGQTVRVNQVRNPGYRTLGRGPRALFKAYAKYGAPIPSELASAVSEIVAKLAGPVDGDPDEPVLNHGVVTALPQIFDSEYLAQVSIGTPPQLLNLDFDTGSADLWVFSSETPKELETGQVVYEMCASTTAQKLDNATWSISYGDGSGSSGNVYLDTVSIGGITVASQAVESATLVTSAFTNDTASSGLLGLAMHQINQVRPTPAWTFFENAMGSLALPLFTANLRKSMVGNYNFGFLDSTEYDGDISYISADLSKGFWEFTGSGYAVGNDSSTPITPLYYDAIVDTGTTLLMLPWGIVKNYYSQVPSAQIDPVLGGYIFDCDEALPDLTLAIGSYRAIVPGSLLNYAPVDTGPINPPNSCFGGMQEAGAIPFAIFGDVFLKSQFVVFHGGNEQLGFAPKAT